MIAGVWVGILYMTAWCWPTTSTSTPTDLSQHKCSLGLLPVGVTLVPKLLQLLLSLALVAAVLIGHLQPETGTDRQRPYSMSKAVKAVPKTLTIHSQIAAAVQRASAASILVQVLPGPHQRLY